MTPFVSTINLILSILTLIGDTILSFAIILILLSLVSQKISVIKQKIFHFWKKNATLFASVIAFTATFGSLFYSEVAKFTPCVLCWYQRILMYPQAIILTMAYFLKDTKVSTYAIVLSAIGGILALYHYILQLGIAPIEPCSLVGYSVSCAEKFTLTFGYVTIPMMSLTAFLLILTSMILVRGINKKD